QHTMASSRNQQVDELNNRVLQLEQQSKANQQHLMEMSGRRPSDWLIAEADYLARMAGRKLWLEHDVATAILMLQSADTRLAGLNDPSLLPVREKIADDIQTLSLINPVSLPDVALQLTAMLKQVDSLPLAMIQLPEPTENNEQEIPSDSVADWKSNISIAWNDFIDNFFNLRRHTDNVQPLLSEQQQWLVKEQLKHYLQQAELVILREQTELFAPLLTSAQQNLQQYFDLTSSRVNQFNQQLQQLATTDIRRDYPEQLQSIRPLQDLLQQRVSGAFESRPKPLNQPDKDDTPSAETEDHTL